MEKGISSLTGINEEAIRQAFGKFSVVDVTFVVNDSDAERARVTGNLYSYKCPVGLNPTAGGLVVVDADGTFKLAKVVAVFEDHYTNAQKVNKATKWVVDVVDLSAYNTRRMADESLTYAKNRLEEKKKAFEQVQIYEYLAKTDPEAKALLNIMKISQGIDPNVAITAKIQPSSEVEDLKSNI